MTQHEELREHLRKALSTPPKPKPKPEVPTAAAIAAERFNESNKPTERIVADATAHSEALANRLREEREAARRVDYQQALIDRCWAQHRAAQEELEAYGRSLCHRGPDEIAADDWVWRSRR